MSSNKKKDNKTKQKIENKAENEPIKSGNSSKDSSSVPQPFNTSDSSFLETMEQLVSNDKEIREKAAQKTKEYMKESYTNTDELYEKISKSLFYFYWNTDKSAYQLAMAKLIASFIFIKEDDKTKLIPKHKLWITTFLSEISNKFQKIDVLRLDKYIMMCDQVISTYLTACLENKFYKSIINLVKYFIKEIESNNNFNFTFESNKIKVISRFVKLLLQDNSDDKNELKNKEDYLNDEENGFIIFYKKLLMLYMTIKDKREIKNFTENIFDMLIKELVDNKNKNNIINKIKEKSESFLKENKPQLNGPKILAIQYFINKLKDEKFQKPIKEDSNVVDPVNDYIMKKNYMAKFKKSKEEIKKERLLEKEKKKEIKNKQKEKEKENEDEKENLKKSDKKEKNGKKEEKKDNQKNSDKKGKLNKLENISKELDFENIKVEKELINLEEEEDKSEENEKENKKDDNKQNKLENKKEKKDKNDNKKQNENKQKEKEKENKVNKEEKKSKDKKLELKTKEKNSSDDESLVEDSDEDEELLEENDNDDDDDSENNNNDKIEKNKKLKEKIKLGKEEEELDNIEEDEIDNEEDMMEEVDLDDEEYEVNEEDLENYEKDLLMTNSYSDKNTLKNTQINIKQGLLNKKTQRNFYRNNVDKNKKKKISFSMENNVVSIYNSNVPISSTSKKKNVFTQGGTTKQSLLKKNK